MASAWSNPTVGRDSFRGILADPTELHGILTTSLAHNFNVGVKHDAGKLRWDITPWAALEQVQAVIDHGAEKYAVDNWYKVSKMRYFAAAIRHLVAWRKGQTHDPESGLPHLAHAAANVLFIMGHEIKEKEQANG